VILSAGLLVPGSFIDYSERFAGGLLLQAVRSVGRCNRVNSLLQMRDGRFLLLDSSMCFEELVEQHRVYSLVANGISGRGS